MNNRKPKSYAPLFDEFDPDEIKRLETWLKGRDWVSTQNVWIQGLLMPPKDYTRANSIRVGFMLTKKFGWIKTGRRANIDGERHWVYVPKGSKQYVSKAHFLHASEVAIDEGEITKWLSGKTYTTAVEILYRVFRIKMPRYMDSETLLAIDEVRAILANQGWTVNSNSKKHGCEVFYRDSSDTETEAAFDDILG